MLIKGDIMKLKMPKNLVLVRHGESELNVISKHLRKNDGEYPESYRNTPDREYRLTLRGREQAKEAGEYLKKKYDKFDIIYVSDFIRARETVALICVAAGWDDVQIKIDPQLGERHWGNFNLLDSNTRKDLLKLKKRDPIYFPMPDGETLLETRTRSRTFLNRCSRQYGDKKILVITHGEYIESIWSEIAHFHTETQKEFFESHKGDIKNCQIIDFESKNGKFHSVSSSNVSLNIFGEKEVLEKTTYSPKEILAEVNKYKKLTEE
jgi:broad specificity phosphatase PhoE